MKTNKNKLIILFIFASVLMLTGYYYFNNVNKQNEIIELHIIGEALPPLESLGELAKEYESQNSVKLIIHPYEFQTALNKTQLDFESNNPQYDIIMGIFYNHGKYYENKYIVPFKKFTNNPKLKTFETPSSNFYPAIQDIDMFYDSELIGYPFSAQTMFLWYRKDLFNNPIERKAFYLRYGYELPVPNETDLLNWKQYENIADFFTRKKGDSLAGEMLDFDFYGTTLQLKKHPCSFYEFTNFVYSFGGEFFDKEGNNRIVSKNNIEALEYYLSLIKYSPPGVTQYTWDDALSLMQQNKIAMTIMWSDAPSALDDPTQSKVVNKVGYSLVPIKEGINKKVSVFGGWAFLINAKSERQNEAYKFIQWACSPKIQLKWAKSGGLPASKNIFDDKEYLSIPYMKVQNEALKNLVSWPRTPNTEVFISKGEIALSKAAIGELTPRESLEWLSSQINESK